MRDWFKGLRRKLEPPVSNLKIYGVHEGSQSFVLWKNRQYAANRRTYDRKALVAQVDGGDADLMVPAEVVVMEKIPVLGTGKIDMVGVAQLVRERAASALAEAVVA